MQRPTIHGSNNNMHDSRNPKENKLDQSQRSCMFYKLLFSLLVFSDENNIYSKIICGYVRRLFQQIVSIIVQFN